MFLSCLYRLKFECKYIEVGNKHLFSYLWFMPCPFTGHKIFSASLIFLCRTKKMNCIQCHFKQFCAGTITKFIRLINRNHLFVLHKRFGTGTICRLIFGMAQNIWTCPKHFVIYKRTRHQGHRKIWKLGGSKSKDEWFILFRSCPLHQEFLN